MRKLLILAAVSSLAAAGAVPALASTRSVKVGDNFFGPKTLTVKKGTTIHWSWHTSAIHNVVGSGRASFSSGSPKSKGSYSRKLTRAGTYKIVCVVHSDMRQTIKVK